MPGPTETPRFGPIVEAARAAAMRGQGLDPAPMAPPPPPSLPQMAAQAVQQQVQAAPQPAAQPPRSLDAVLIAQAQMGQDIDPQALAQASPETQQRVMAEQERRGVVARAMAPVAVPYTPGREAGYVPGSRQVSESYTPGTPERIDASRQLEQAEMEAAALAARSQSERMQAEYQQARLRRAELEQQAQRQQEMLAAQQSAADRDLMRVREIRSRAQSMQLDPGRVFRGNPASAIAASLGDVLMALGGRVDLANSVQQMIDRDVALQQAEYQMLGDQAANAFAAYVQDWGGDLAAAELALKETQAAVVEQQIMQQASAFGLQELPQNLLGELNKIRAQSLQREAQLAANAKQSVAESYAYQQEVRASGGGMRAPTMDEINKRLAAENTQRDLLSQIDTGRTRKELAAEQEARASQERAESAEATKAASQFAKERADLVDARDAFEQLAEATGGVKDEKTGQYKWAGDMRGYAGGLLAPVARATGAQQILTPDITQYERNALDALGRMRSGGQIGEQELKAFESILLGSNASEAQVQRGINMMLSAARKKEAEYEAAAGAEARAKLESERQAARREKPDAPMVEPR